MPCENRRGGFSEDTGWYDRGEWMIDKLSEKDCSEGYPINVIPEGESGECHDKLIVAIGNRRGEDIEKRILQALEHVHIKCPGRTNTVIFWTAKWDISIWSEKKHSFSGVKVILKQLGSDPTILA